METKRTEKGEKKQQRREAFPQCFLFYNEFNQWLYDIPQRVGVDADDWPATVLDVRRDHEERAVSAGSEDDVSPVDERRVEVIAMNQSTLHATTPAPTPPLLAATTHHYHAELLLMNCVKCHDACTNTTKVSDRVRQS